MVDLFRKRRTKKNVKTAAITVVEWILTGLTVVLFWKEIVTVFTGLIDALFPRSNLSLPTDVITSLLALIAGGTVLILNVVLFLSAFVRKAGLPIFSWDDLANQVPLEADEWETEYPRPAHQNTQQNMQSWQQANQQIASDALQSPRKQGNHNNNAYPLLHNLVFGRFSQMLTGTLLQLLWFFGLRGMNVVIHRGKIKSGKTGKEFSHVISSVVSDYDSGFLLDTPQDEGDRRHVPPIPGWYGLRYTYRRGLRGTANLGRITRTEQQVTAYTRDGIEIQADVVVNFILGQRPECVEIGFVKPYGVLDQRVVSTKLVTEPYPGVIVETVEDDELDVQDKTYIHSRIRDLINAPGDHAYVPKSDHNQFEFNRGRVFRAISSESIDSKGDAVEWELVPLHYAKEMFQKLLLNYTYDELFGDLTDVTGKDFPIDKINADLRRRIRNNSILAYRLVWAKRSMALPSTEEGSFPYRQDRLRCAPTGSYEELPIEPADLKLESDGKGLRARGIKLINASFENLHPRYDEIDTFRGDIWQAPLDHQTNLATAEIDRENLLAMSRASVETQELRGSNLLKIIESGKPDEVVMMELLSSLGSLVNRDDLGRYLPKDVNTLISSVDKWFNTTDKKGKE